MKTLSHRMQLASTALELFGKIGNHKNHFSVNTLLSICSASKPETIISVWDEIAESNNVHRVSQPLIIKCCSNVFKQPDSTTADIQKCIDILLEIKSRSFNRIDPHLHSALISGHCACSQLVDAQTAFTDIPPQHRSPEHLGALLTGFANHKRFDEALSMYNEHHSLHHDVVHLVALRICRESGNGQCGQSIISKVVVDTEYGVRTQCSIELLNSAIDFHGHFGDLDGAQSLFMAMSSTKRDAVSLNCMMTSYLRNDSPTECIAVYEDHGHLHDDVSHLLALRACVHLNALPKGRGIVDRHVNGRESECSTELLNMAIAFHGSFGEIETAQSIFHRISDSDRTAAALGAMMKCHLDLQQYGDALSVYDEYGHLHNDAVHLLAVRACALNKDFERGLRIIEEEIDYIRCRHDSQLLNAMIDFYGECGDVESAKRVFWSIADRKENVVSIGSMMKCLIRSGQSQKALTLHRKTSGVHNDVTNLLALKAAVNVADYEYGHRLIADCIHCPAGDRKGVYSVELATTLIAFYGESGDVLAAEGIFHSVPGDQRNVVMVNAMMNAYCLNDAEADCLELMDSVLTSSRFEHVEPDHVSFATALKACVQSTALHFGQRIHEHLRRRPECRWILQSVDVQICLICVYGKGSKLELCTEIWNEIKEGEPLKYRGEIALWNAMMNAFGRNGELQGTLCLFERMKRETELVPNDRTYCIVVNACSHSGDVQRALEIWNRDIVDGEGALFRNVNTALIDCLSRKGLLEEALRHLVEYENMEIAERQKYEKENERHLPWMALMNGCCKHGNRPMAERVFTEFKSRFSGHPIMAQAAVLISNTFAQRGGG